MATEKITLTFSEDGTAEAHAEGFTGGVCEKEIDKLLVGRRVETKRTGEFYKQDQRVAVIRGKK